MYIGRFAPSPTGSLHIGSLLTALASYADAKSQQGKWLVRIEDIDPPREVKGAADEILHTLESFGFEWDDGVIYQSRRQHLYRDALNELMTQNLAYPCFCSRKDWHNAAKIGVDGFVYNGHCRPSLMSTHKIKSTHKQAAWRIIVPNENITFNDAIIGLYTQNLAHDIGDFVLLRADGYWAYQLAVVVDDAEQGITHIVRGQDLLVSTPRQIYLQRCLKQKTPHYAHLPLLVNQYGQKWSKQTLAPKLNLTQCEQILRQVMHYLNIPNAPSVNRPQDLLTWTIQHWQINHLPTHSINTEKETK